MPVVAGAEDSIEQPLLSASTSEETLNSNNAGLEQSYGAVEDTNDGKTDTLVGLEDGEHTTEKFETKFLIQSTIPVSLTFVLQYFLSATSIFVVGHLGTAELGAISLVSVTVGVLGYAIIIGVATCLDTLASQAYGRGDHRMVGIHTQRCAAFIFTLSVPIALMWFFSEPLLAYFVPQKDLVEMTSNCLKIYIAGLPGYIIFEVAKHFLQVQGIFHASTYILLICTPINMLLNYLLVWNKHIGIGLLGAPTAVVTTDWLMAIMSLCYIAFIDGRKCWTPITADAFRGWGPMCRLAVAGVIMTEAEWLAFDFLTMSSSRLGTTVLAAQSIMSTLAAMAFQMPLAMGIACSTRVGNLIGANAADAAKVASNVGLKCSLVLGTLNASVMYFGRYQLARIFSDDEAVVEVVASVIPLASLFQFNDSLGAVTGGILRGQGRQWIGGIINVVCYYIIMIPLAWSLAFVLGWGLQGLWTGMAFGLLLVSCCQLYFVQISNWRQVCIASSKLQSEVSA